MIVVVFVAVTVVVEKPLLLEMSRRIAVAMDLVVKQYSVRVVMEY